MHLWKSSTSREKNHATDETDQQHRAAAAGLQAADFNMRPKDAEATCRSSTGTLRLDIDAPTDKLNAQRLPYTTRCTCSTLHLGFKHAQTRKKPKPPTRKTLSHTHFSTTPIKWLLHKHGGKLRPPQLLAALQRHAKPRYSCSYSCIAGPTGECAPPGRYKKVHN
jgi:hypothetical protein